MENIRCPCITHVIITYNIAELKVKTINTSVSESRSALYSQISVYEYFDLIYVSSHPDLKVGKLGNLYKYFIFLNLYNNNNRIYGAQN